MNQPRVLVLRAAGTNCDLETVHAWELAGAAPQRLHVRKLIESPSLLDEFAILTIPGGFSYGDDIAAGKILAVQMIHHLAEPLRRFVEKGRLVLGICNGFQVLVKAGLLPGFAPNGCAPRGCVPLHEEVRRTSKSSETDTRLPAQAGHPALPGTAVAHNAGTAVAHSAADHASERFQQTVTVTHNDSARYEDRWIHLKSSTRPNAFMPGERIMAMPVAHGEGKVVAADDRVRRQLREGGHVALTYCDADGRPGPYPINPNGSEDEIAGLVDATGRVLGLMPHPERHVDPRQHPEWTSRRTDAADGRVFFETAVRTARG